MPDSSHAFLSIPASIKRILTVFLVFANARTLSSDQARARARNFPLRTAFVHAAGENPKRRRPSAYELPSSYHASIARQAYRGLPRRPRRSTFARMRPAAVAAYQSLFEKPNSDRHALYRTYVRSSDGFPSSCAAEMRPTRTRRRERPFITAGFRLRASSAFSRHVCKQSYSSGARERGSGR